MTNTQELRRLRILDVFVMLAEDPSVWTALLDELDALRADRTTRDREKFNEGIDKAEQIAWNGRDEEGRKTARAVRALRLPEKEGR